MKVKSESETFVSVTEKYFVAVTFKLFSKNKMSAVSKEGEY